MSANSARMACGTLGNVLTMVVDGLNQHRVGLLAALNLNLGDAVSTHIGLAGGIPEGNPVPARLLASGGELAFLGAKFGVAAAVVLVICLLGRRYPRLWHAITVTNVVLAVVVVSNVAQILGL
jgi:hypothetical protein